MHMADLAVLNTSDYKYSYVFVFEVLLCACVSLFPLIIDVLFCCNHLLQNHAACYYLSDNVLTWVSWSCLLTRFIKNVFLHIN